MLRTLDALKRRLAERIPKREPAEGALEAAVALLLAPAAEERLELLFVRRAVHPTDPWSGQMALPGGRREPEDRDLLETVRRETLEEVGVTLHHDWLLGELDDMRPRTPTLPPVLVRPYVFGLPEKPPVQLSSELALHLWVPVELLASGAIRDQITLPERQQTFPAYRVGEQVIWGMTERIITPFFDLLK